MNEFSAPSEDFAWDNDSNEEFSPPPPSKSTISPKARSNQDNRQSKVEVSPVMNELD